MVGFYRKIFEIQEVKKKKKFQEIEDIEDISSEINKCVKCYKKCFFFRMVVTADADINVIEHTVKKYVPGALVSRQHGKELAFRLPLSEVDRFPGE